MDSNGPPKRRQMLKDQQEVNVTAIGLDIPLPIGLWGQNGWRNVGQKLYF